MVALADVPFLKQATVTSPAAGAEWRYTCPGQGIQRIIAMRAILNTSAAVATRIPSVVVSDGSDDFAVSQVGTGIGAGQACVVTMWPGCPQFGGAAGPQGIPAPTDGWLLLPGWSIRSSTLAIDVGDTWTAIRLWVAEYPTGPQFRLTPDVYSFYEPKG